MIKPVTIFDLGFGIIYFLVIFLLKVSFLVNRFKKSLHRWNWKQLFSLLAELWTCSVIESNKISHWRICYSYWSLSHGASKEIYRVMEGSRFPLSALQFVSIAVVQKIVIKWLTSSRLISRGKISNNYLPAWHKLIVSIFFIYSEGFDYCYRIRWFLLRWTFSTALHKILYNLQWSFDTTPELLSSKFTSSSLPLQIHQWIGQIMNLLIYFKKRGDVGFMGFATSFTTAAYTPVTLKKLSWSFRYCRDGQVHVQECQLIFRIEDVPSF